MRPYQLIARLTCFTCFNTLLALMVSPQVGATTSTWTGNIPSSMNNSANWSPNSVPISGDPNLTLVFPQTATSFSPIQDIANPLVLQSISVDSGYLFGPTSTSISFKNLGGAPTLTFGGSNIGYTSTWQTSINFVDPTIITSSGTGNGRNVSFTNALSGTDVTFTAGAGLPTSYSLTGATSNLLSGVVTIQGGAVVTMSKSSGATAMGGTVIVDGAGSALKSGTVSPNQFAAGTNLQLQNGGALTLDGTMTVAGLVVESGGTIQNSFGNGDLIVTGPISSSTGLSAINTGGNLDINGGAKLFNITNSATTLNVNRPIVNGTILKTGAGKLGVHSSANSFSGTNVVNAGTLVGGPLSIGTVNLVNAGSTAELNAFGTLNTGQIFGAGKVVLTGGAIVDFASPLTYLGGTELNGGSASGDATALAGTFTGAGAGGSLIFNQSSNTTWSGQLNGVAAVTVSGAGVLGLGGTNNYTLGTQVQSGNLDIKSDTALGTGPITSFVSTIQATGNRTLNNQIISLQDTTFTGTGNLTFNMANPITSIGNVTHNSTGITDIPNKWNGGGAPLVVNAGHLKVGDASVVNGFTTNGGQVVVNGGTLTIRSLNFISLPDVALAGGNLNVPNGYAISLGAVLQGYGAVTGRLATANGSTILATANLVLGDVTHVAGVNLDGELYTGANTVALADANQAVLGSLTQLGDGTNDGILAVANGAVLNFGRNIAGRGKVTSSNSLAKAVIVNGDVRGDSLTNYIEFTGYVKGVGTFTNVAFSGTFSPGLSPALLTVNDVVLTPDNRLNMEIGGVTRGSQYDSFDIDGTLKLGGTLEVSLLDGFRPSLGDQFDLFDGDTVGAFTNIDLPPLVGNLAWDTSKLYTQGTINVAAVPEPTACGLLLLGGLAALCRRDMR